MRKFFIGIVIVLIVFSFLHTSSSHSYAQFGQIWETIVGDPNLQDSEPEPDPGGGSGGGGSGNDGLGPGEFRPPFKCGLVYTGQTYAGHTHWAVDFNRGAAGPFGGDFGDPVYAAADGVVKQLIPSWGQIHIQHEGGFMTAYTHMNRVLVKYNDRVKAGQKVGEIGNRCGAGCQLSSHLHYHVCGQVSGCMVVKTQVSVQMKFFNRVYPVSCYNCSKSASNPISCRWPWR